MDHKSFCSVECLKSLKNDNVWKVHYYFSIDITISGGGKNNTVLVTGVVVTVLVLIMVTLLFGAIIIWFRKRYSTS